MKREQESIIVVGQILDSRAFGIRVYSLVRMNWSSFNDLLSCVGPHIYSIMVVLIAQGFVSLN